MINMGHCRFQNTESALGECLDALQRRDIENIPEKSAAQKMFSTFLEFCYKEGLVSEYDKTRIIPFVDSCFIEEQEVDV